MTEQAIETAAAPVVETVLKALTPEAEAVFKSVEARLVAEAEHLKAEIEDSHNSVITWLRNALGGSAAPAATAVDPTPAVPAPQA